MPLPLPPGPFYSRASRLDRIAPGQIPGAIGILADLADPGSQVGIAFEDGRLGGWYWDWSRPGLEPEYLGPHEAVWRLVVAGEPVDGRYVLRAGRFQELAEDAR